MPYRIKAGQSVMLFHNGGAPTRILDRTIVTLKRAEDFDLTEVIASPLVEHRKVGISKSAHSDYPWGFKVKNKWDNGLYANTIKTLFATEVHQIISNTPKTARFVAVSGSGTNTYTLELGADGLPISCTCPAFRYRRTPQGCKHMLAWTEQKT